MAHHGRKRLPMVGDAHPTAQLNKSGHSNASLFDQTLLVDFDHTISHHSPTGSGRSSGATSLTLKSP